MKNSEFRLELQRIENEIMRLASDAMYEGWQVTTKSLTKMLMAVDLLKEAKHIA